MMLRGQTAWPDVPPVQHVLDLANGINYLGGYHWGCISTAGGFIKWIRMPLISSKGFHTGLFIGGSIQEDFSYGSTCTSSKSILD